MDVMSQLRYLYLCMCVSLSLGLAMDHTSVHLVHVLSLLTSSVTGGTSEYEYVFCEAGCLFLLSRCDSATLWRLTLSVDDVAVDMLDGVGCNL